MDLQTWTLYAGVALMVIVLPGPAALLCVNHGLRHGSRRTLATVLGGTLSAAVLMGLSALGLWQLLVSAPLAFEIARACGAAYLMLLGVSTWRAMAQALPEPAAAQSGRSPAKTLPALCRDGFLLGISNPKDLLFFGALLPQFLDPDAARAPQLACMFVTWALIDGLAMSGYAALGQRLLHWLADPRRLQLFQRASGAVLVSVGLALGLARPVLGH